MFLPISRQLVEIASIKGAEARPGDNPAAKR
jgi:hypothetical protein